MAARPRAEFRHPLSLSVIHILLALADGARHGYAIKQEVEERSDGEVRLGPGALYEAVQRLVARLLGFTTGPLRCRGPRIAVEGSL